MSYYLHYALRANLKKEFSNGENSFFDQLIKLSGFL